MVRQGRAFPIASQYLFTPLEPSQRVSGTANIVLVASGTVRVGYRVVGSASFTLTASGSARSGQSVRGSAIFTLIAFGVAQPLSGGAASTQFVSGFMKASEAAAGLALVDEYSPTHPYLEALSVSLKEIAEQGEPTTTGQPASVDVLAKFTGPNQLANSIMSESSGVVTVTGDSNVTGVVKVAGTQVIGTRKTGYVGLTGTANRGTGYTTGAITLSQLAERVKALQDDLASHGVIGS